MTYSLEFKKSALKEWKKLGHTIRSQFKKKAVDTQTNGPTYTQESGPVKCAEDVGLVDNQCFRERPFRC